MALMYKKIIFAIAVCLAVYIGITWNQNRLSDTAHSIETTPASEAHNHITQDSTPIQPQAVPPINKANAQASHLAENKNKPVNKPTTAPNGAKDYDTEFYDKNTQRVKTDDYGNHFVDLSNDNSSSKRFLISNWPLYYPSPIQVKEGQVEGCMSLNYYVSLGALVTLVIAEKNQFRMHHWECVYDSIYHKYQLNKLNAPPADLIDSIQSVVNKTKN